MVVIAIVVIITVGPLRVSNSTHHTNLFVHIVHILYIAFKWFAMRKLATVWKIWWTQERHIRSQTKQRQLSVYITTHTHSLTQIKYKYKNEWEIYVRKCNSSSDPFAGSPNQSRMHIRAGKEKIWNYTRTVTSICIRYIYIYNMCERALRICVWRCV